MERIIIAVTKNHETVFSVIFTETDYAFEVTDDYNRGFSISQFEPDTTMETEAYNNCASVYNSIVSERDQVEYIEVPDFI